MAMYESDNRAAPVDKREIAINGKLYHYKTETRCSTCAHERHMYAKMFINAGSDVVIECPVCDTSMTTKTVLAKRAE